MAKRRARWSPLAGDPRKTLASIPPTAKRILDAAMHVITTEGFDAMSLNRVAELSGEAKPTIHYYFGSKAGLVGAVADALIHDFDAETLASLDKLPLGVRRVQALVRAQQQLARDARANVALLEILPRAARTADLRDRLEDVYSAWRVMHVQALTGRDEDPLPAHLDALGALSLAISDGLSIQYLLGHDDARLRGAARLWEAMVIWLFEQGWRPDKETP